MGLSTVNQFPYYKHYFEDATMRNQSSSGTFYKNKKALKEKNSTSKIATITTEKVLREEVVGGSQGRRISSAKPRGTKKEYMNEADKLSIKGSSTRNEEETGKEMSFEPVVDNASIFRNKKLEAVGRRKRKSSVDLADSECLDA